MVTFLVTNDNDSGAGSLRAAINNANANPGADVIQFDPDLLTGGLTNAPVDPLLSRATITLTSGELSITDDLTIDGDIDNDGAADIEVNGNGNSRVFKVEGPDTAPGEFDSGPTIDVALNGLFIINGQTTGFNDGGGIWSKRGALTITNSQISDNAAGPFEPMAAFNANGGGISLLQASTLELRNSTVSNNTAADGGGIYVEGNDPGPDTDDDEDMSAPSSAVIINSTIAQNAAQGTLTNGAGLNTFEDGEITLINSTVAGNALFVPNGTTGDGAGIWVGPTGILNVQNSIVAGNFKADFNDGTTITQDVVGPIAQSNGSNIFTSNVNTPNASDLENVDFDDLDWPGLGPNFLTFNSGGTQTIPVGPDSIAIDAGNDADAPVTPGFLEDTDQRGEPRFVDGDGDFVPTVDIGATEFEGFLEFAEFGTFSGLTDEEETVFFNQVFDNPVVIAQPLSFEGSQPAAVRITDIQADRFSFAIQEPANEPSGHVPEDVSWLVVEAGTWQMPTGFVVEAGMIETDVLAPDNFESVDFDHDFGGRPAVLSQVQTDNGVDWVVTRQRQIDAEGFEVAMQEEEARGGVHTTETVGYVALERGQTTNAGNDLDIDFVTNFDDEFSGFPFIGLEDDPVFLASLSSFNGEDPASLRYDNLSALGVDLKVQEDQSSDTETAHTEETIDFVAIEGPTGTLLGFELDPEIV